MGILPRIHHPVLPQTYTRLLIGEIVLIHRASERERERDEREREGRRERGEEIEGEREGERERRGDRG